MTLKKQTKKQKINFIKPKQKMEKLKPKIKFKKKKMEKN